MGEDVRTDLTLSWGQGGSGSGCSGTWFWAHRGSILAVWLQVCQLTSLKLICCVCKTGSGNTSLPLLGQKCSEWAQDQAGGCPPILFLSVGHARHGASAGMAPGLGPTLWADGNARLPSKLSVAAKNTKHPAEPTGHLQHPLQKGPWWAQEGNPGTASHQLLCHPFRWGAGTLPWPPGSAPTNAHQQTGTGPSPPSLRGHITANPEGQDTAAPGTQKRNPQHFPGATLAPGALGGLGQGGPRRP